MTVDRVWQRLPSHLLSEPDKELRDLLKPTTQSGSSTTAHASV
jgi:hypothetical protein